MKRYCLPFKFIAFLLASICFLGVLVCGYGTVSLFSANLYQEYPYSLAQSLLYEDGKNLGIAAARYYYATTIGECPKELVDHLYGLTYYGGSTVSVNQDGAEVYFVGDNIKDGITIDYQLSFDCPTLVIEESGTGSPDETENPEAQPGSNTTDTDLTQRPIYTYEVLVSGQRIVYKVRYTEVRLNARVTFDQSKLNSTNYQMLSTFFPYRYVLIAGLAFFLLVGISLLIYLLWAAGRSRNGNVELSGLSKLPLDIYLAFILIFYYSLRQLFYGLFNNIYPFHIMVFNLTRIALAVPLLLGFLYILAAQSKCRSGYWWWHTLIGQIIGFFLRGIRALFRLMPAIWQWLVIGFAMAISLAVSFVLGFVEGDPVFYTVFLLCVLLSFGLICYGGYCLGMLLTGAKKMAQGELSHKVPEAHLIGAFRDCARQLNCLSGAADEAMQQTIRSERMKTELITNVSHDIKTPLTSIINFVDLLGKPHTPEDEAQYLEVLSRQSQSLKKLIEDLMELSKANTGNMTVNLSTLDAVEVANQALGEFSDKLAAAQLTPVFRTAEESLSITADGRLVWRVMSNILGNVAKYAAPNTRVYVDLTGEESSVRLSVRNISRAELNVSAEELLERFVQGDVSRNSEGSGLGLNIAKCLMEIQGGSLQLTLDGDLFKVTLTFPRA